jgi:signal transduction histidine kinase
VRCESSDNGDPIADENRELIFDPYQRGDAPAGMNHSLGLGLHISRTLARRMGGDLTYGHADGMSTFELTLPSCLLRSSQTSGYSSSSWA